MSTDLHKRMLAFNDRQDDPERAELMRKVWEPTPWMVDVYTGNYDGGREREMLHWCFKTLGQQASPIHERIGLWQRGHATINGWSWFGFSLERDMKEFVERWPSPTAAEYAA
jgi:hypothetical protein